MRITYLKLLNFKRFPLRDIEIFEEDFSTARLIGILGCNGSGKTSLLKELSPFPSSKENFFSNGYKEIHITHRNNEYILISSFGKESYFSFLVNNDELNKGNLITIQKELIKKHFNLTEDIFDILIGNTSFSSLNSLQRKKLFNSISNFNLEELFDIYEKIKEEEKIENSILKNLINSYNIEINKIQNKDLYNQNLEKRKSISEFLNILIDLKSNLNVHIVSENSDTALNNFKEIENKIHYIRKKYFNLLTSFSFNNLQTNFEHLTNRKNFILAQLNFYFKETENIDREIKKLKIANENSRENLLKEQQTIQMNIENTIKNLTIIKNVENNIEKIYEEFLKVENALISIFEEIENNEDKKYTLDKYNQALDEKEKLLQQLNKLQEFLIIDENRLKHLKDYHLETDIECPKCKYTFSPSLSKKLVEDIKLNIQKNKNIKIETENKLKQINDYIEKCKYYFSMIQSYEKLITNTPLLEELWNFIKNSNILYNNKNNIYNILSIASQDLNNIKNIQNLQKRLQEITNILKIFSSDFRISLEEYELKYKELDEEIFKLNEEKKIIENYLYMNSLSNKVYGLLKNLLSLKEEKEKRIYESFFSDTCKKLIEEIDIEIAKSKASLLEIETFIRNFDTISSIIEKYKNDIEISKRKTHVINLLLKEISPKNGLIAKIISEYLNGIIAFVNKVIESIMEYDLKIDIINTEENVLDYKFKFKVENKIEVNDISKASSGMREIIDLGFKLVLYKILKLENYPLYLDEFGVRLDTLHRSKIHNLIFKFINDSTFSQIFLITHYDLGLLQYRDSKIIELS